MAAVAGVWDDLRSLGKVTSPKPWPAQGVWQFEADTKSVEKACPRAKVFKDGVMWRENIATANKKGWDWSGDTDVSVYTFTAPSLKEAIVVTIAGYATYGRGTGTFYVRSEDYGDGFSVGSCKNWPEFWESAVGGENNLPKLAGAPDAVVVLINNGNDRLTLGQKGTTFYVVDYTTS